MELHVEWCGGGGSARESIIYVFVSKVIFFFERSYVWNLRIRFSSSFYDVSCEELDYTQFICAEVVSNSGLLPSTP